LEQSTVSICTCIMEDLFSTAFQQTPEVKKDVVVAKKASVSSSRSLRGSSAKSTPHLTAYRSITPKTDDKKVL